MARRDYGKPYDPALRKTEHGEKLYNVWRRVRRYPHCEEWDYFPTFYEWAMQSEYTLGAWLRLRDQDKPFSPDNYIWYVTREKEDNYLYDEQWIADWNKTVNRIRKHFGLPPLEGTSYGDL